VKWFVPLKLRVVSCSLFVSLFENTGVDDRRVIDGVVTVIPGDGDDAVRLLVHPDCRMWCGTAQAGGGGGRRCI